MLLRALFGLFLLVLTVSLKMHLEIIMNEKYNSKEINKNVSLQFQYRKLKMIEYLVNFWAWREKEKKHLIYVICSLPLSQALKTQQI